MINGMNSLVSIAAALAAVLVLIWIASRVARFGGMARRPAGGTLSVQDVLALDSRRHLHLVKCGDKRVLLLTGGAQDVVVGWLDAADPVA